MGYRACFSIAIFELEHYKPEDDRLTAWSSSSNCLLCHVYMAALELLNPLIPILGDLLSDESHFWHFWEPFFTADITL